MCVWCVPGAIVGRDLSVGVSSLIVELFRGAPICLVLYGWPQGDPRAAASWRDKVF